jgi:hypothetical protein
MVLPRRAAISFLACFSASFCACRAANSDVVRPSLAIVSGGFARTTEEILAEGGVELRSAPLVEGVSAMAGLTSVEGGAIYYYGGLRLPLVPFESERWLVTPSVAAGVYDTNDNDHIDLGGPVEFRSAIEFSYALNDWLRIGLYVAHLSNANLYDQNRGAETAGIALSLDLEGWIRSD